MKGTTMIQKLERKFGKYSVPHLMNYIIGGYIIGYCIYIISLMTGTNWLSMLQLQPHLVLQGQVWRIVSWVLIPPIQNPLFELIMMFFYWQLGNMLEGTWGTFRFNLYIFGGIFFTIIGSFVAYGVLYAVLGIPAALGGYFTTEYINMSIFLAFAVSYPDMQIMLYFLIPIKMKWMSILYGILIGYEFLVSGFAGRVAIISSMLNFAIFFLMTRNYKSISPYEQARKAKWKKAAASAAKGPGPSSSGGFPGGGKNVNIARHKCAICGRTDISNPELTFRFCSKCNGNYEYCNDHLFTHQHKE